jgi:hypothetical protein
VLSVLKWFQNFRSGSRARRGPIEKAQHTYSMRAFIGGLQRSHWALDGGLKPLLRVGGRVDGGGGKTN